MTTDCRQRWRAKCNHVRTGGLLTTPPPTTMIMPESNTTSIVFTTSVTTIARLNSGIRNRQFFCMGVFFVSINESDSVRNQNFGSIPWEFDFQISPRIFKNAWVALIYVGVSFSKSLSVVALLPLSFWHICTIAYHDLISKDVKFSCASFDLCQKFAASCSLPKRPRKIFKNGFSIYTSQEIGSSLILLKMIFEAPQS